MPSINLDGEFLKLFYGLTDSEIPNNVDLAGLKSQLYDIVNTMVALNQGTKTSIVANNLLEQIPKDEESELSKNAILVIDDLGVITYQLKVLLSKFEMDVDCSQEIYDAVNKYKKRKYLYVIMDLFIPTEREGFILLTELKKLSMAYNVDTVIGVITASPRKEIEQQCRARGADFFLEKSNEWQSTLLKIMNEYIGKDNKEDDGY